MKVPVVCLLLAACVGASHDALQDTPTARSRRAPQIAPPASVDDRDRYKAYQDAESIRDAEDAYRDVERASQPPPPPAAPPGAGSGSGSAAARPVKRGPAEQAPKPTP